MILPRLSIILPVVNAAPQLAIHLKAIQRFRAYSHVTLVDGSSKDGSAAIAATMVDDVIHCAPGRAKQMNVGASHADGEILLFLSADTRLPDNAIKHIVQAINNGSHWGRFEVGFDSPHIPFRWLASVINGCARVTGIMLGQQAMFMTRTAFQRVGGFPDIDWLANTAISVRLKTIGDPACLGATTISPTRRWQRAEIFQDLVLKRRVPRPYFFGAASSVGRALLSLILMLMALFPESLMLLPK